MGLFGGDSSSSSDTTAVTGTVGNYGSGEAPTVTTAGANRSTIINATAAPGGGGAPLTLFKSKGNTINTSDYGAIEAGASLARAALDSNGQAFRDAIARVSDSASAIVNKTLGIAEKTQVSESAQMQDTLIKFAMIAGAAVALIMIFKRG